MTPRDPLRPGDEYSTAKRGGPVGLDRTAHPRASSTRILSVLLVSVLLGVIAYLVLGAQVGVVVAAIGVMLAVGLLGSARSHP